MDQKDVGGISSTKKLPFRRGFCGTASKGLKSGVLVGMGLSSLSSLSFTEFNHREIDPQRKISIGGYLLTAVCFLGHERGIPWR